MQSFISFIMAILALFASLFSFSAKPEDTAEDFVPVLRFMVCSDTHINSATDTKRQRITDAINFSYNVAEEDSYYNDLDAVLFAGDLTEDGTMEEFEAFRETVKNAVRGDTSILAVVAKNHDSYVSRELSTSFIPTVTGNSSDFHVVINGYHFIGISTAVSTSDNAYTIAQRIWLEKQLKEAAEDDPDKPIFVMHHEHVMDTVYGSTLVDGWGNLSFRDIIERYPQVVDFSGHSHYPLNDPRSIWQGTFTAVGTGAMSYMDFTVDGEGATSPDCHNGAQAWIVEVDADNQVRLRGFNVITSDWLCEYLVTDPGNASTYTYTPLNRKKFASAPEFEDGAEISSLYADGKCTVTVPAAVATDNYPIFLYRVNVYNKYGIKVYSDFFINNYWQLDTYKEISFTVDCEEGNKITVTAENSYGMQSEPLSCTVA